MTDALSRRQVAQLGALTLAVLMTVAQAYETANLYICTVLILNAMPETGGAT